MDRRTSRKAPDRTGKQPEGFADAPPGHGGERPAPVSRSPEQLLAECRVDTFRAGGPGGQHQNKVESGVRLTHRPTGIVTASREHRSQMRNREEALARLAARLDTLASTPKPRVPTAVPKSERRKRLEEKKRRSRLKKLRGKPDAGDR